MDLRSSVLPGNYRKGRSGAWIWLILLMLGSLILAGVVSMFGPASFFLLLACLCAGPLAYTIVAYPKTGVVILLVCAYVIMFFSRLGIDFPVGTVMDGIIVLLLFSILLRQRGTSDWSMFRSPISLMILVWVGYNCLEAINPAAESRLAWLYTVRTMAGVTLSYFVFVYYIRDVRFVRTIIRIWLGLSILAALYAFKQEHLGFFAFEKSWLASDEKFAGLYYIGNHWRKFSIFADPVTFAYNMLTAALLCFCLATGIRNVWRKLLLTGIALLLLVSMLYSGTRSAFAIVPAALVFLAVLKFNRKVMLAGALAAFCLGVLIFVPTSNYTLYRFQTAFRPSEDASYNLRVSNQKKIQPYIQSHPLGGGLGSTGVWGQRFSPGSYLSNFPPDSGYVRVAVELGWLGLLVFCTFMFTALATGISAYLKIRNRELKAYCLGMLVVLFAFNLGSYPQEALVQYPSNIFCYLTMAMIVVCRRIDLQLTEDVNTVQPDGITR